MRCGYSKARSSRIQPVSWILISFPDWTLFYWAYRCFIDSDFLPTRLKPLEPRPFHPLPRGAVPLPSDSQWPSTQRAGASFSYQRRTTFFIRRSGSMQTDRSSLSSTRNPSSLFATPPTAAFVFERATSNKSAETGPADFIARCMSLQSMIRDTEASGFWVTALARISIHEPYRFCTFRGATRN